MGEAAAFANRLIDQPKGIDKQLRLRTLARVAKDLRATGVALGILGQVPAAYLAARRDRLVKARKIDVAAVDQLIANRAAARAAKDFARADAIRGELDAMRVGVIDTPAGTTWRVLDDAS
jgi:cysteinyl-tRNA synthetase